MTGFIALDKPEGLTSFSATALVRRITGEKKAGHTGTLDPMATGVLPVALGAAPRFIELLPDKNKEYTAVFTTGITTDTLDITGTILTESGYLASLDEVTSLLPRFTGVIEQLPPMYSAVKKDGVRLYELARRGISTEREPRTVTVFSLTAHEGKKQGEFVLNISCSSGTYVRTIISDLGEALNCGAVMTSLRRNVSNGFTLKDSLTPAQLEELKDSGELSKAITPVDAALESYPAVTVTEKQATRFSNGGELGAERVNCPESEAGLYRIYSPEGDFKGIGELINSVLTVKRVYVGGKNEF